MWLSSLFSKHCIIICFFKKNTWLVITNCWYLDVLGKQTSWSGVAGQRWKTGGSTKPNCKTPDNCGQHYERTGTHTFYGLFYGSFGGIIFFFFFSVAFHLFCFSLFFLCDQSSNLYVILFFQFGDLDPGSADFFLQEERINQLRTGYEAQYRVTESKTQKSNEIDSLLYVGRVILFLLCSRLVGTAGPYWRATGRVTGVPQSWTSSSALPQTSLWRVGE